MSVLGAGVDQVGVGVEDVAAVLAWDWSLVARAEDPLAAAACA